jgi:hypothetical protein
MNKNIDTTNRDLAIRLEAAEEKISAATLAYCDPYTTTCNDENHYCPTCEYHLDEDGSCMNCDFS